jgi:hypothetical protein
MAVDSLGRLVYLGGAGLRSDDQPAVPVLAAYRIGGNGVLTPVTGSLRMQ